MDGEECDGYVDAGGDGSSASEGRRAGAPNADGATPSGDSGAGRNTASVHVRNIGGIEESTVALEPGVTVLAGRNATNRTSFLRALRAVMGGETTPLKRDADEGTVELRLDGRVYTRWFERTDGGVAARGTRYLDDHVAADTFAVLLEHNDVRRVVRAAGDPAEVLMRPVDTDAIEAEIGRLAAEKRRVDDRLADLDSLDDERTDLLAERERLEGEIEALDGELADLEERIAAADGSIDAGIDRDERLEARLTELRDTRAELQSIIDDLDTERDSLAAVEREHDQVESELAATAEVDPAELVALEDDLAAFRERKRELDADVSALQGIVRFNEDQLDDGGPVSLAAASGPVGVDGEPGATGDGARGDSDHVTDSLSGSKTVACWTCGTTVERTAIEGTLDRLRDLRERTLARRREVTDRIERLKARRDELDARRQRRTDLKAKRDRVAAELERREERISDLERRRRDRTERVQELEATVEELRTDEYAELLDLHRRANEHQVELERYRSDLATVESELAAVDEQLDERADLRERREEIQSELVELRTRLDRLAEEVAATFNDHMDAVLDALDYENVERVRLDRKTEDGRSTADGQSFDVRVVREGSSGGYEDTPETLSESEREVVGLVLALAGYLVHDVHETAPFLLLDSLEAIDADRIASLVDHFAEYAEFLVVALLEEDAAAVDGAYDRVTGI